MKTAPAAVPVAARAVTMLVIRSTPQAAWVAEPLAQSMAVLRIAKKNEPPLKTATVTNIPRAVTGPRGARALMIMVDRVSMINRVYICEADGGGRM